MKLILRDFK